MLFPDDVYKKAAEKGVRVSDLILQGIPIEKIPEYIEAIPPEPSYSRELISGAKRSALGFMSGVLYALGAEDEAKALAKKAAEYLPHPKRTFGEKVAGAIGEFAPFIAGGIISSALRLPFLLPVAFGISGFGRARMEQVEELRKTPEGWLRALGAGVGEAGLAAIPVSGVTTKIVGKVAEKGILPSVLRSPIVRAPVSEAIAIPPILAGFEALHGIGVGEEPQRIIRHALQVLEPKEAIPYAIAGSLLGVARIPSEIIEERKAQEKAISDIMREIEEKKEKAKEREAIEKLAVEKLEKKTEPIAGAIQREEEPKTIGERVETTTLGEEMASDKVEEKLSEVGLPEEAIEEAKVIKDRIPNSTGLMLFDDVLFIMNDHQGGLFHDLTMEEKSELRDKFVNILFEKEINGKKPEVEGYLSIDELKERLPEAIYELYRELYKKYDFNKKTRRVEGQKARLVKSVEERLKNIAENVASVVGDIIEGRNKEYDANMKDLFAFREIMDILSKQKEEVVKEEEKIEEIPVEEKVEAFVEGKEPIEEPKELIIPQGRIDVEKAKDLFLKEEEEAWKRLPRILGFPEKPLENISQDVLVKLFLTFKDLYDISLSHIGRRIWSKISRMLQTEYYDHKILVSPAVKGVGAEETPIKVISEAVSSRSFYEDLFGSIIGSRVDSYIDYLKKQTKEEILKSNQYKDIFSRVITEIGAVIRESPDLPIHDIVDNLISSGRFDLSEVIKGGVYFLEAVRNSYSNLDYKFLIEHGFPADVKVDRVNFPGDVFADLALRVALLRLTPSDLFTFLVGGELARERIEEGISSEEVILGGLSIVRKVFKSEKNKGEIALFRKSMEKALEEQNIAGIVKKISQLEKEKGELERRKRELIEERDRIRRKDTLSDEDKNRIIKIESELSTINSRLTGDRSIEKEKEYYKKLLDNFADKVKKRTGAKNIDEILHEKFTDVDYLFAFIDEKIDTLSEVVSEGPNTRENLSRRVALDVLKVLRSSISGEVINQYVIEKQLGIGLSKETYRKLISGNFDLINDALSTIINQFSNVVNDYYKRAQRHSIENLIDKSLSEEERKAFISELKKEGISSAEAFYDRLFFITAGRVTPSVIELYKRSLLIFGREDIFKEVIERESRLREHFIEAFKVEGALNKAINEVISLLLERVPEKDRNILAEDYKKVLNVFFDAKKLFFDIIPGIQYLPGNKGKGYVFLTIPLKHDLAFILAYLKYPFSERDVVNNILREYVMQARIRHVNDLLKETNRRFVTFILDASKFESFLEKVREGESISDKDIADMMISGGLGVEKAGQKYRAIFQVFNDFSQTAYKKAFKFYGTKAEPFKDLAAGFFMKEHFLELKNIEPDIVDIFKNMEGFIRTAIIDRIVSKDVDIQLSYLFKLSNFDAREVKKYLLLSDTERQAFDRIADLVDKYKRGEITDRDEFAKELMKLGIETKFVEPLSSVIKGPFREMEEMAEYVDLDKKLKEIVNKVKESYVKEEIEFRPFREEMTNLFIENPDFLEDNMMFMRFLQQTVAKVIGDKIDVYILSKTAMGVLETLLDNSFIGFSIPKERIIGIMHMNTPDMIVTFGHELFHFIWKTLDKRDRQLLIKEFGDIERVADRFGEYVLKKYSPPPIIRRIFDWIVDFIHKFRNYLAGMGFWSPEDVFGAIWAGKYAKGEIRPEDIPIGAYDSVLSKLLDIDILQFRRAETYFRSRIEEHLKKLGDDLINRMLDYTPGVIRKALGEKGIRKEAREFIDRMAINMPSFLEKYFVFPQFNKYLSPIKYLVDTAGYEINAIFLPKIENFLAKIDYYRGNPNLKHVVDAFFKIIPQMGAIREYPFDLDEALLRHGIHLGNEEKSILRELIEEHKSIFDLFILKKWEIAFEKNRKAFIKVLSKVISDEDVVLDLISILSGQTKEIGDAFFTPYKYEIVKETIIEEDPILGKVDRERWRRRALNDIRKNVLDSLKEYMNEDLPNYLKQRGIEDNIIELVKSIYKTYIYSQVKDLYDKSRALDETLYFPLVRNRGKYELRIIVKVEDELGRSRYLEVGYFDSERKLNDYGQRRQIAEELIAQIRDAEKSGAKYAVYNTEEWIRSGLSLNKFVNYKHPAKDIDVIFVYGIKAPKEAEVIEQLSPGEALKFITTVIEKAGTIDKETEQKLIDALFRLYADESYVLARTLKKRWLPEQLGKTIAGYKKDYMEVVKEYFYYNIGHLSNSLFNDYFLAYLDSNKDVINTNPDIAKMIKDYHDAIVSSHSNLASFVYKVRTLMAIYYLGLRLSTALWNNINAFAYFIPEFLSRELAMREKYLGRVPLPEYLSKTMDTTKLLFSSMAEVYDFVRKGYLRKDLTLKPQLRMALRNIDVGERPHHNTFEVRTIENGRERVYLIPARDFFKLKVIEHLEYYRVLESSFMRTLRMEEMSQLGRIPVKIIDLLMSIFTFTERNIRLASALAIAEKDFSYFKKSWLSGEREYTWEDAISSAVEASVELINRTYFDYTRANRPSWANPGTSFGAVMTLPLTLRGFILNSLSLFHDWIGNRKFRELAMCLGVYFTLGGLAAIPLFDDMLDIFERILKEPIRMRVKNEIERKVGKTGADFVIKGVPYALGLADIASSIKIELPLPKSLTLEGWGEFLFGVYKNAYERMGYGLRELMMGEYATAFQYMLPIGVGLPFQAYLLATEGLETKAGKKILMDGKEFKLTPSEAFVRALGFRPKSLAEVQDIRFFGMRVERWLEEERDRIYEELRSAKTNEEFNEIFEKIKEYNAKAIRYGGLIPPITSTSIRRAVKPKLEHYELLVEKS